MHKLGYVFFVSGSLFAGALYLIGLAVYNLYFHPFRNVPGEKLYAMSRLFWIRDWLSGNLHRTVRQMHGRYGEIVRVAPDELSFINPAAWSEIYGSSGGGVKALIRDPKWYANLTEGQDDIIVANEVDHSRFRKLLSPGLSEKSLRDNEHLIHNNISLLLTRLKGQMQTYGTVDMVKWYNFTTFDVIGDLVYGESFGCLQNSDYHPWLGVVLQNFKLSSYVALMERYSFVKKLVMIMLSKDLMEKRNMHLDVVRAKCAQRAESTREKKDIISTFPGKAMMTKEETEANLALLTVAGSETSATCLAAATYSLCKNRSSARILQTEILEAFIDEKNIMWDAVKKLPYLNAVIKEALRLYPPTPVGLPRRVVTDGIMTVVYITQYSAYRSSLNFKEPNLFRPERWLDDQYFASDRKEVFQPFITGPYSCIGKSLAYMEISLILARMVWNFEWDSANTDSAFEDQKVYALWQKSPLNMRLMERAG